MAPSLSMSGSFLARYRSPCLGELRQSVEGDGTGGGIYMRETKICNQCEEELPIEKFSSKGKAGGRKGKCNSCRYNVKKDTDPKFNEKEAARKKAYRKAYLEKHGVPYNGGRSRHGMHPDERDKFKAQNDGMCSICNINPSTDVDHDHACCPGKYGCSKCVRDPLCNPCNSMLGAVNDSKAILQAGILYLCKWEYR